MNDEAVLDAELQRPFRYGPRALEDAIVEVLTNDWEGWRGPPQPVCGVDGCGRRLVHEELTVCARHRGDYPHPEAPGDFGALVTFMVEEKGHIYMSRAARRR